MNESKRALHELARAERGLEIACRILAGHARGLPVGELERFAAEHAEAADFLGGLIGAPGGSLPAAPWFDRAGALTVALRGTAAIVSFLDAREHELLHRYCRELPRVDGERRLTVQQRFVPPAMSRLAILDRLGEMTEESCLSA